MIIMEEILQIQEEIEGKEDREQELPCDGREQLQAEGGSMNE